MTIATTAKVTKEFSWREGSRYSVEAEVFAKIVERIERLHKVCTPAAIVEAARPIDSPIHKLFNWDDAAAAELYRQDQARGVMHSLRVTIRMADGPKTDPIVAYVAVNRENQRGYVNSQTVVSDPTMYAMMVSEAKRTLEGWKNRYKHLTNLREIILEVFGEPDKAEAEDA